MGTLGYSLLGLELEAGPSADGKADSRLSHATAKRPAPHSQKSPRRHLCSIHPTQVPLDCQTCSSFFPVIFMSLGVAAFLFPLGDSIGASFLAPFTHFPMHPGTWRFVSSNSAQASNTKALALRRHFLPSLSLQSKKWRERSQTEPGSAIYFLARES